MASNSIYQWTVAKFWANIIHGDPNANHAAWLAPSKPIPSVGMQSLLGTALEEQTARLLDRATDQRLNTATDTWFNQEGLPSPHNRILHIHVNPV